MDEEKMRKEPIILTEKIQKQFRNALIGKSKDYKTWQDWYAEGDLVMVSKMFKEFALEMKKGTRKAGVWNVVQEIAEFEQKKKVAELRKMLLKERNVDQNSGDPAYESGFYYGVSKSLKFLKKVFG